jgi:hypothetical protein
MAGQLWLTTKNNPPRLCTLTPLAGSRPDQFALKLGETSQNGQHQATMRRCGVSPTISERFEPSPFFGDRPEQIEEIASGPRQSIEPGDDQHVLRGPPSGALAACGRTEHH